MGKLKKDISSSVYLQFVNKIWKNTSTCCTCTIRNGECVIIAQKGKCKALENVYGFWKFSRAYCTSSSVSRAIDRTNNSNWK